MMIAAHCKLSFWTFNLAVFEPERLFLATIKNLS